MGTQHGIQYHNNASARRTCTIITMQSYSVLTLVLCSLLFARAESSEATIADSVNEISSEPRKRDPSPVRLLQQQNSSQAGMNRTNVSEQMVLDCHDQPDEVVMKGFIEWFEKSDPDGKQHTAQFFNATSPDSLCKQLKDAGEVDHGCLHVMV